MNSRPERAPAALAAELYLLLLPSGHLLFVPVAGAMATATDVALMLLLVATAVDLLARPRAVGRLWESLLGRAAPGTPSTEYVRGLALLTGMGVYVALTGLWGFHPRYAVAKGVAFGALSLGALALAVSGIGRRRAVDAWLAGAALALLSTLVLGLVGGDVLRARVVYQAGGVMGLPFPRISGPLLHPNMLGDYLLVSGVLLWGRWPELSDRGRRWGLALAAALVAGLFLTVSTAWIALGVVLSMIGRREGRTWLRVLGVLLAAATLFGVLVPLDFTVAGFHVASSGVRPQIWRASLYPVAEGPLLGVGASPYLTEVVDPLTGDVGLWDAHNLYLSILGQFGLVGFALVAGGVWLTLRGARRAWGRAGSSSPPDPEATHAPDRMLVALLWALIAVALHGFFLASEDLRHVWALLGLVGVAAEAEPPTSSERP